MTDPIQTVSTLVVDKGTPDEHLAWMEVLAVVKAAREYAEEPGAASFASLVEALAALDPTEAPEPDSAHGFYVAGVQVTRDVYQEWWHQQERTPSPYVCADCPGGPDQTARAERAEARIAELEAERDAAKQWATELQGRQRHHIARIEHLEAELREVLRSPGDIHVVLDGIRRALTTSTQEDARR